LWQLGESLGYQVQVSWLATSDEGEFSVAFVRDTTTIKFPSPALEELSYANAPIQKSLAYKQTILSELKQSLQQQLPDYMNPAHYVILEQMPVTPNGKIDRKALLAIDVHSNRDMSALQAAQNDTEQSLIDIWQNLLHVQPIGTTDNFFELGGHSLLATQFISRVRDIFGLDVPVSSLFEKPTIIEFAAYLETQQLLQVDDAELAAILAELEQEA